MSAQDKLRLHLADKTVTWREDVPDAVAAQTADAVFVAFAGPVTAATVIDAYNVGRGRAITLVHDGPVGDVARRSAARFGVSLLDAASLPEPAPAPVALPDAPVALVEVVPPALPAPAPEILLPAHVEPVAAEPLAVPALPWDASVPPADPFQTAEVTLEVTPHDLLAMPWAFHDEHVEVMEAGRAPKLTVRPTTDLHPEARNWGLPWPRPVVPADGLAIADPRIWNNQGRLDALHAQYDAVATKLSAPAPGPDAAAWLKRLQLDGPK